MSRWPEKTWLRLERNSSPEALQADLRFADASVAEAQRDAERLRALLELRLDQVERGTWPRKVTEAAWRDVKPGDVIADPDKDITVERAETTPTPLGDRTRVWFRVGSRVRSRNERADGPVTLVAAAEGRSGG